jgi:concanavalin A-like lectin/glucanase superfamily protein
VNNQPIYTRPVDIGGDFSITTALHNTHTDSLYVNGLLVLQQGGKYPAISGSSPTAMIGAGPNNNRFTGNIGEILIYDRALSASERQLVEHYLRIKYGVL